MADFNDSELFSVFDKTSSSVGTRKKGAAASQKRKRSQEPTADPASSSKRSKRPQRVPKAKPQEVVVIKDSSDEFEEVNVSVKSTELPAVEKTRSEKDGTDG